MKCLFLAPKRYPFIRSIEAGMKASGLDTLTVDYPDFFSPLINKAIRRFTSLPNKVKSTWEGPYNEKVNRQYLEIYKEYKPDLVLIYNNQLVHPEFLEFIRSKSKIAFILGDNPLYSRTSLTNLHILFLSDYVISPDSLWQEQLVRMGVKNVVLDFLGFSDEVYHPISVSDADRQKYSSEFIFIGNVGKINWGYKRLLFLNLFRDYDLKAYLTGGGIDRWLKYFPELKEKVQPHNRFDSAFNNLAYNCSKIAPMEQVPSLFNGIHARVFDTLGAGILPLCEYSSDMERVFHGIDVPLIRNYNEVPELADYWLKNDLARKAIVERMRARATADYSPTLMVQRMLNHLFMEKRHQSVLGQQTYTTQA